MKKKLQLLEQLQSIDTAIDFKKKDEAEQCSAIAAFEQSVAEIAAELEAEQERMREIEVEKAELEKNLETELESIKRSESNMKEIRTNKEYQAVGREIAAARKQVSELEEQVLQKTASVEESQALINAKSEELAKKREEFLGLSSEANVLIANLQSEISVSETERAQIVKSLPSSVVRRYDQLRQQRRGQALAEARDGSCQGCNMNLPPQLYNMLFKGEELHFCPHCQRILLLKQNEG